MCPYLLVQGVQLIVGWWNKYLKYVFLKNVWIITFWNEKRQFDLNLVAYILVRNEWMNKTALGSRSSITIHFFSSVVFGNILSRGRYGHEALHLPHWECVFAPYSTPANNTFSFCGCKVPSIGKWTPSIFEIKYLFQNWSVIHSKLP